MPTREWRAGSHWHVEGACDRANGKDLSSIMLGSRASSHFPSAPHKVLASKRRRSRGGRGREGTGAEAFPLQALEPIPALAALRQGSQSFPGAHSSDSSVRPASSSPTRPSMLLLRKNNKPGGYFYEERKGLAVGSLAVCEQSNLAYAPLVVALFCRRDSIRTAALGGMGKLM